MKKILFFPLLVNEIIITQKIEGFFTACNNFMKKEMSTGKITPEMVFTTSIDSVFNRSP